MILIFSQAAREFTTEEVIDWLDAFGAKFVRVNGEDLDSGGHLCFSLHGDHLDTRVEIDGVAMDFLEVQAVWFRRWISERRYETEELLFEDRTTYRTHHELVRHLTTESLRLRALFFSRFSRLPWLGNPERPLAKLDVLGRAARVGIETPDTLVTTRRVDLERFSAQHGQVITKPLSEVHMFNQGRYGHFMYTSALTSTDIGALPESFAPSLFQRRIAKAFELRVFYLQGDFYAMAIFSQSDVQTQVDFRIYNFERPNRSVPYRLPCCLTTQLRSLMDDLSLDTGSLDLIVTPEGRYVFLEVNPAGQFGMVSKPCNYHLERKVAESLIRKAENARH